MSRFFASFPAGGEEIVSEILRRRGGVETLLLLPGAVEFETDIPYSDLNLFCFQNVFQSLYRAERPRGDAPLNDFLREVLALPGPVWAAAGGNSKKINSFRLVTSLENRLTAVDANLKARLEKKISQATGLRVDRSRPDTEFWLLCRREGQCWFLKRLSRHRAYDKALPPGQLRPELSYLLCCLSEPGPADTVLDPFCGYGGIPKERCKRFPYEKLYAFDSDEKPLSQARKELAAKRNVEIKRQDVLTLSKALPPESVDAVITDPPWGLYQGVGMELREFYRAAFTQLETVLKPGGRLVVLTAAEEALRAALTACPSLTLQREFHILVSGKKSGVFKIVKQDRKF